MENYESLGYRPRPLQLTAEHSINLLFLITIYYYYTMSESNASIPIMRKPVDEMSTGLNSSNLAASAMQRHPIDRMQRGELKFNIMYLWYGLVFTWCSCKGILADIVYICLSFACFGWCFLVDSDLICTLKN